MSLPNIFDKSVSEQIIARINKLSPETEHLWGKMTVDQMLAHCNVTYEYIYEPTKYKQPNFFIRLMLRYIVKGLVTSEKPYKKSNPTGKDFLITDKKDFEFEKKRLVDFIDKTQKLGEKHFDGLESHSFGKLTASERNNMFYKHLDHHLNQFGV